MVRFNLVATCLLLSSSFGFAQEAPSFPGPVSEHKLLKKFVGTWKTTSESFEGEKSTAKADGTMTGTMLGEFWLLSETKASMGDFKMRALQTIGYDTSKKKYVGTWVDSIMNHMWHYEGTAEDNRLILNTEGPNYMAEGRIQKFRDIYEFVSDDEIRTRSEVWQDDQWVVFMRGSAKRTDSQ